MKKINLENMIDVCGGRMTPTELDHEITFNKCYRKAKRIVILMDRNEKFPAYYTQIYIPIKDFEKKKR